MPSGPAVVLCVSNRSVGRPAARIKPSIYSQQSHRRARARVGGVGCCIALRADLGHVFALFSSDWFCVTINRMLGHIPGDPFSALSDPD